MSQFGQELVYLIIVYRMPELLGILRGVNTGEIYTGGPRATT